MMRFILALALLCAVTPAFAKALPAPNDKLTPGAIREGLTDAQIHKQDKARPALPSAVVKEVARRYGIALTAKDRLGVHDPSCGKPRCEIDHLIPYGCGGASTADNLWYQDGADYPKKDQLEHWAERQATIGKLSITDCQKMFRAPADWRVEYRKVFNAAP